MCLIYFLLFSLLIEECSSSTFVLSLQTPALGRDSANDLSVRGWETGATVLQKLFCSSLETRAIWKPALPYCSFPVPEFLILESTSGGVETRTKSAQWNSSVWLPLLTRPCPAPRQWLTVLSFTWAGSPVSPDTNRKPVIPEEPKQTRGGRQLETNRQTHRTFITPGKL